MEKQQWSPVRAAIIHGAAFCWVQRNCSGGKAPLDQTSTQCHPSLLQFSWKHSTGGWSTDDGASSSREGSGFAQGSRDYSQGCLPDPSAPATVPRCCLNADILTARSLPGTRSGVREQQDVLMSFQITIFLSERAFWHHVSPPRENSIPIAPALAPSLKGIHLGH